MKRRSLLAVPVALAAAKARSADRIAIVWWHAMTGALADEVNRIADGFNASQGMAAVQPVYKGSYPDTLTAAIAASRAGEAPHIVQVFEVGTGTMLAAGKAVKQVWELAQETGLAIDPAAYIPAVRGYYSLADGRMASMPFNSSTAVMWYSKDAFRTAGLDPDKAPATWAEVVSAADSIKGRRSASIAMTTSWPAWIQVEQFCALHDLPFASRSDGFDGLDAELLFNAKPVVGHIERLLEMARAGTFIYGGRDAAADPLFVSGEAAIAFGSSASRGNLVKSAKFEWAEALLPYDPAVIATPKNSIIGGASLWTMTAPKRTAEEYKAVALFLQHIGQPAVDSAWAQATGYVQVTLAGFERSKAEGFYAKAPGAEIPVEQLERGTVTANTRGLRLGRLPEIRNIVQEELENALQGGQTAQAALDNAVSRGNRVLRDFAKSVKA